MISAVGRRRQTNLGLPPRMHSKGGCYYYVTSTVPRKWIKLHADLGKARIMWAQIENGESGTSGLFSDHLDTYLVSSKFNALADKTRRQYEHVAKTIREYFKGAQIGAIAPAHVAIYMDNHPSQIQANTSKAVMSNVFELAVRHGVINANPCKQIGYHLIKGRDRLITDEEYQLIWDRAEDHVRIAMDIGYLTGTRIQDILDIKLQDISAQGIYIKQGKTKKKILFLVSPAMEDIIDRARKLPRAVRGLNMLCTKRGSAYGYDNFNLHWLAAVRAAGVEGVHFHDIRAKAATDAKELGLDYQALLGHASRAMSDRYIRGKEVSKVTTLLQNCRK